MEGVCCFEERMDVEDEFAYVRGAREAVESDRAAQPTLRSWLLFCRRDIRSIVPANTMKKGQRQNGNQNRHATINGGGN